MSTHKSAPSTTSPLTPSTYPWPELIKRWQYEQLSMEQAIGQLLLWGQQAHAEANACRHAEEKLTRQVAELEAQIGTQGGAAAMP